MYACFSYEKNDKKAEDFSFAAGGCRESAKLLSQTHLIWGNRVLTIGPSFVQCLFLQISHPPFLRNGAETSPITPKTVKSHGQGSFSSLHTPSDVSSSQPQAEGMEIIDEKANDPHNPPMETEEIVSVLDRESLVRRPPLRPLHIAHLFPTPQMKLSLPNTCLIWAMTLKSSRFSIGSSRAGRNSTRN